MLHAESHTYLLYQPYFVGETDPAYIITVSLDHVGVSLTDREKREKEEAMFRVPRKIRGTPFPPIPPFATHHGCPRVQPSVGCIEAAARARRALPALPNPKPAGQWERRVPAQMTRDKQASRPACLRVARRLTCLACASSPRPDRTGGRVRLFFERSLAHSERDKKSVSGELQSCRHRPSCPLPALLIVLGSFRWDVWNLENGRCMQSGVPTFFLLFRPEERPQRLRSKAK